MACVSPNAGIEDSSVVVLPSFEPCELVITDRLKDKADKWDKHQLILSPEMYLNTYIDKNKKLESQVKELEDELEKEKFTHDKEIESHSYTYAENQKNKEIVDELNKKLKFYDEEVDLNDEFTTGQVAEILKEIKESKE